MRHVIVITKVTARPIPSELPVCLDTPKKGHIPKNYTRIKLLTNTAIMIIIRKLPISLYLLRLGFEFFGLYRVGISRVKLLAFFDVVYLGKERVE